MGTQQKKKKQKITGKACTEEEMEDYKRKLWDEHKRAIQEINIYLEEREKIIRDREAEIEKEKVSNLLSDLLSDPVF